MSATIEEVETRLRAAVGAAKALGLEIRPGKSVRTGTKGKVVGVCPIGAYQVINGLCRDDKSAAKSLHINVLQVIQIQEGFDGLPYSGPERDLGRRLRADYLEKAS